MQHACELVTHQYQCYLFPKPPERGRGCPYTNSWKVRWRKSCFQTGAVHEWPSHCLNMSVFLNQTAGFFWHKHITSCRRAEQTLLPSCIQSGVKWFPVTASKSCRLTACLRLYGYVNRNVYNDQINHTAHLCIGLCVTYTLYCCLLLFE